MKDLGEARRILGMDIKRDRDKGELWLVQTDYLKKLIQKFQMDNSKSVSIPLGQHFKLSLEQVPKTEAKRREVHDIPYANIIGSIMYCMILHKARLGSWDKRHKQIYERVWQGTLVGSEVDAQVHQWDQRDWGLVQETRKW